MKELSYVLIDPTVSKLYCIPVNAFRLNGISVEEAIAEFKSSVAELKSSVWDQGWSTDKKVMDEYGDYLVYEQTEGSNDLVYKGLMRDFT